MLLLFFFNDTATTEIYTLSLHDALPILPAPRHRQGLGRRSLAEGRRARAHLPGAARRRSGALRHRRVPGASSEEHTSELQSPDHFVGRLLLAKKNIRIPLAARTKSYSLP